MALVCNAQRDLSFKKFVKLRRNISKLTSIITRPTGDPPAVTSKKTLGQAMFYEMFEILDDFFLIMRIFDLFSTEFEMQV